jgi:hypothetical protein
MPSKSPVRTVTTIGIDMGKTTLHMVGLNSCGAIVLQEKVSRGRIASRLANLPPCLIGIEAGMATHYVARELSVLGHDVKQVPPAYAKPFRQTNHLRIVIFGLQRAAGPYRRPKKRLYRDCRDRHNPGILCWSRWPARGMHLRFILLPWWSTYPLADQPLGPCSS